MYENQRPRHVIWCVLGSLLLQLNVSSSSFPSTHQRSYCCCGHGCGWAGSDKQKRKSTTNHVICWGRAQTQMTLKLFYCLSHVTTSSVFNHNHNHNNATLAGFFFYIFMLYLFFVLATTIPQQPQWQLTMAKQKYHQHTNTPTYSQPTLWDPRPGTFIGDTWNFFFLPIFPGVDK